MGRAKLCMEMIRKDKTRMQTYKKRKAGLMKKAYEFATLCDVEACIIMYGPNEELNVWPGNHDKVKAVVDKYMLPENINMRGRKPQDLSDFFAARKKKIKDDIAKVRKINMDLRYPLRDNSLESLSFEGIACIESRFDGILHEAKRRLLILKSGELFMACSSSNNNNHLIGHHSHQLIGIPRTMINQKPLHHDHMQLFGSYSSHPSNYQTPQHQQQSYFGYPTVNNSLTMLLMRDEESNQFGGCGGGGGGGGGGIPYTQLTNEACYYDHNNPSSGENLHMMFNKPRTSLASDPYYLPGMPPSMLPYDLLSTMNTRNPSQFQAPQFTDLYNTNAYGYGMDPMKKHKLNYI